MTAWADAARTALGFFWKAGWAFVVGYFISGAIQAFVPKGRLTRYMGDAGPRSVSLATVFGAASSSCSFAALAAARSLVLKGAHFVAAVAFMFASTNLVIELGILIFIFLGWQFVAAEIVGGVIMIVVSAALIRVTYPRSWLEAARERVEESASEVDRDFDWKQRITSRHGWRRVGHNFVSDWKMVWEEIVIGFTVAGFVAVFVPDSFWAAIFLTESAGELPGWLMALENALVAPLVAAATFIGSMGNIPLATILNANGVLFAGIMGFIYSDLVVPPLVAINAKYYGLRVALFIAAIMYVSIVITALILHGTFGWLGVTPESQRAVSEVARFEVDYTFWLNLVTVTLGAWLVWMHRRFLAAEEQEAEPVGGLTVKRGFVYLALVLVVTGAVIWLVGG